MDRRTLTSWVLAGASAMALVGTSAAAQERGQSSAGIPAGHLPPPGQCRVWYDDRPPGHQPPPTGCDAARREAYRTGARVVYGGGTERDRWEREDDHHRDDADGRWDRDDDRDRDCDERDHAKGECRWDDREDRRRDRTDRDDMCRDGDRDGRCDYAEGRYPEGTKVGVRRYPATLPQMVWGVRFGRGDRTAARGVRQWLGTGAVRARYVDANRNGRPEAVSWTNARGVVLQRWVDTTGDGRADRVTVYTNGRVTRVIR